MPYKIRSFLVLALLSVLSWSLPAQDYHDPYMQDGKVILSYNALPEITSEVYRVDGAVYGIRNIDPADHQLPVNITDRQLKTDKSVRHVVPRYRESETDEEDASPKYLIKAQSPGPGDIIDDFKEAETWDDLVTIESAVMTFIIMLGGWLSAFIPGLNAIDKGVYRVLTWAILVVGGASVLGFADVWQGALVYFFSTSLYEVVFKLFAPSPKPDPL